MMNKYMNSSLHSIQFTVIRVIAPKPEDFIFKESYIRLHFHGHRMQRKKITEILLNPSASFLPKGGNLAIIVIDFSHLQPTKMCKPDSIRMLVIHGSKIHFKPYLYVA